MPVGTVCEYAAGTGKRFLQRHIPRTVTLVCHSMRQHAVFALDSLSADQTCASYMADAV